MAEARARRKPAARTAAKKPKSDESTRPPEPVPNGVYAASKQPVCQVGFCPICMAVSALGEVRPELLEHLVLAGREMLLALRAVVDSRLSGAEDTAAKLERLVIE